MTKILAFIDTSPYANSVCGLTAWAGQHLPSSVEVLHVVQRKSAVQERHDRTGAIGLGVKSDLLEELTRVEEAQGKLAIEAGRVLLDAAAERLRATGIHDLTLTHRHGGIVETILEREEECDLLVMGNRGDRKSTRLNSSTNAHLVCRLRLDKRNRNIEQIYSNN